MRKLILLMLLAGAASPALAAGPDDRGDRPGRGHRGQQSQSQSDDSAQPRQAPAPRPERNVEPRDNGNRAAFGGGGNFNASNNDAAHVERPGRGSVGDSVRSWRQDSDHNAANNNGTFQERVRKPNDRPTLPDRPELQGRHDVTQNGGDSVRNWRRVNRGGDGEHNGSTIEDRNVRTPPQHGAFTGRVVEPNGRTPRIFRPSDGRISRTPMAGTQPPPPRTRWQGNNGSNNWRSDWRHDRRYDWRDWRRRHGSSFRIGFYYDPFGWDYMRYGIGWRLWPSYYSSNFWLNDSWQYRLPPAYGPYRWIRYYNDALLVNIYTGQVVDVEYDFFW